MIRPENLTNRQAVHQPRPFDRNEPSTIAPVSTPEEDAAVEETTREGEPGEHAEIPHPLNAVVEGEEDSDDDA